VGPTLTGFIWFLQNIVGISTTYLPSDAPVISWCYDLSINEVNQVFQLVPTWAPPGQTQVYTQMVYNLGAHDVILLAPDVSPPPTPPYMTSPTGQPIGFFEYMREKFGLNTLVPGVVTQTFDAGTGTTLTVAESLKNLTIEDLGLLQTPWGRTYLGQAMKWNQPWGLS
jgi:hypothetical protein